jgi:hypothetical protein
MKAVRHQRQTEDESRRAGNVLAPPSLLTLDPVEKHYLIWGLLRLALGVVQMVFATTAILCLIFSGFSSATLTCIGVASIATLVSRILFHGRREVHRQ